MILAGFGTAWTGHTPESQADADDITAALMEAGISKKTAAYTMGLANEQQFSRQLAGTEPLNHWRLNSLPAAFHVAYLRRQAVRRGAVVIDAGTLSLVRGAALLGVSGCAQIAPELIQERRTA